MLAGGLTVNMLVLRKALAGATGEDSKQLFRKIDQILTKHELTEKTLARLEPYAWPIPSQARLQRGSIA